MSDVILLPKNYNCMFIEKSLARLLGCIIFLLCAQSIIGKNDSDIEKIRKRCIERIISTNVNGNIVDNLLQTLRADGTWPGIDYVDVSRTGFQHARHLANMVNLAIAYKKPGSPFRGKRNLKQAFDKSMAYWLEHDFICDNWWNNQIDTPARMVTILLLMDKDLSKEQSDKMLQIISRGNINATGARPSGDRIKIAGIQAKAALYKRNVEEVEMLLKVIESEIKFSTKIGIQYDYSFHHRADRVNNTLTYGVGYGNAFVEWATLVNGTRFGFSQDSIRLIIDYYLDGICKQMIYGMISDPGIGNRDITRPGKAVVWSADVVKNILTLTDYRKAELETVVRAREGENVIPQSYAKFFWCTDHFVYQRPNFYTSVRMYSERNANMEEPYNGEGIMNHFRGDGTNYLSLEGDEYKNVIPVYDWMKIPGTTTVQLDTMPLKENVQKWGLTKFVGAVSDDMYGAVGFEFKSPHTALTAKKSYFFFDKEYVCLGSGITSRVKGRPVSTTINQCVLSGEVHVKDGRGAHVQSRGAVNIPKVEWVNHDNVGYVFPEKSAVFLLNQEKTGSWTIANKQTSVSAEEVKCDVFTLALNHGKECKNASYEYIVVPSVNHYEMEDYVHVLPVSVLTNTSELQAVRHNGLRIAYAVFYKHGTVHITGNLSVTIDSPGLVMLKYNAAGNVTQLLVSDPTRLLKTIHLSINSGSGVLQRYAIDLPQNEYAGRSVKVKL